MFTDFIGDTRKLFHWDKEFWISQDVLGNGTLFHKIDAEVDYFLDIIFLDKRPIPFFNSTD